MTKDFTFSAAYSYTDAKIKDNLYSEKDYHQQLSGTALTWQPNNWYIVGTASYYKDYVPSTRQRTLSHSSPVTATGWKASSVTPSISTSRSSNRSSLTWRRTRCG